MDKRVEWDGGCRRGQEWAEELMEEQGKVIDEKMANTMDVNVDDKTTAMFNAQQNTRMSIVSRVYMSEWSVVRCAFFFKHILPATSTIVMYTKVFWFHSLFVFIQKKKQQ